MDICFLAGPDKAEFEKWYYQNVTEITMDEHDLILQDIEDEKCYNGATYELKSGKVVVFLRKGMEKREIYVVHECYHAINNILTNAGVRHDIHDEPFAYALGYVVNEYFNHLDAAEEEVKNETV